MLIKTPEVPAQYAVQGYAKQDEVKLDGLDVHLDGRWSDRAKDLYNGARRAYNGARNAYQRVRGQRQVQQEATPYAPQQQPQQQPEPEPEQTQEVPAEEQESSESYGPERQPEPYAPESHSPEPYAPQEQPRPLQELPQYNQLQELQNLERDNEIISERLDHLEREVHDAARQSVDRQTVLLDQLQKLTQNQNMLLQRLQ